METELVNNQPEIKPTDEYRFREFDQAQEQKEKVKAMRPRRGTVHHKVMREVRFLYYRNQQITAVLISRITGLSLHAVKNALTDMTYIKFLSRERHDRRDGRGHIKTFYVYKLTKLGFDWDLEKIPFYPHHPDKTLELMRKQAEEKERIYKEVRIVKTQEWKEKKLIKLMDKGKNPGVILTSYNDPIKLNSILNRIELPLIESKLFPKVNNLDSIINGMVTNFKQTLIKQEKILGCYDEDPKIVFTPIQESKLRNGACLGLKWASNALEKHRLNKWDLLHYGDTFYLGLAALMSECLETHWSKEDDIIKPGHFCSPTLFNNWLPAFLWEKRIYCQDMGIEYGDEIPDIQLNNKEQGWIQEQRRKDQREDNEEDDNDY